MRNNPLEKCEHSDVDHLEYQRGIWTSEIANFHPCNSHKVYDCFTLLTIISHQKLKNWLTSIIWNAFILKNGNSMYKYLV